MAGPPSRVTPLVDTDAPQAAVQKGQAVATSAVYASIRDPRAREAAARDTEVSMWLPVARIAEVLTDFSARQVLLPYLLKQLRLKYRKPEVDCIPVSGWDQLLCMDLSQGCAPHFFLLTFAKVFVIYCRRRKHHGL